MAFVSHSERPEDNLRTVRIHLAAAKKACEEGDRRWAKYHLGVVREAFSLGKEKTAKLLQKQQTKRKVHP